MEKRQCLQHTVLLQLESCLKKDGTGPLSPPYTEIKSKWMKDKCGPGNHKCPGGEHRQPSPSQDPYKFSLEVSPEERKPKTKINILNFIKTKQNKNFCTLKEQATKGKGKRWNGRTYLQMPHLIMGQYANYPALHQDFFSHFHQTACPWSLAHCHERSRFPVFHFVLW